MSALVQCLSAVARECHSLDAVGGFTTRTMRGVAAQRIGGAPEVYLPAMVAYPHCLLYMSEILIQAGSWVGCGSSTRGCLASGQASVGVAHMGSAVPQQLLRAQQVGFRCKPYNERI